jgi:hypothetical protein
MSTAPAPAAVDTATAPRPAPADGDARVHALPNVFEVRVQAHPIVQDLLRINTQWGVLGNLRTTEGGNEHIVRFTNPDHAEGFRTLAMHNGLECSPPTEVPQ